MLVAAMADQSLFDRLGGEIAVMAAVERFYEKVLSDEVTKPFFDDLNMEKQVKKQMSFMAWAFGGPDEYKGRDLREAHAKLVDDGLSDVHFDAVAGHLKSTLEELDVHDELVTEVLNLVGAQRDEVLGR